MNGKLHFL